MPPVLLTKENFAAMAQNVHGEKYDYSKTEYKNRRKKIIIICPIHGDFEQNPESHVKSKYGCPNCANAAVMKKLHGYKYKGVEYRSIRHACRELKKNYRNVANRLRSGWTPEEAFDDEPHESVHAFKINGKIYDNLSTAIKELNPSVSRQTITKRLAKKMTPEEAFFLPYEGNYSGTIYKITNLTNGKQYVGATVLSLKERWRSHLKKVPDIPSPNFHKSYGLHEAIAIEGKENFTINAIDVACNIQELRKKERDWIAKLGTLAPNGYNLTVGGEISRVINPQTKELALWFLRGEMG